MKNSLKVMLPVTLAVLSVFANTASAERKLFPFNSLDMKAGQRIFSNAHGGSGTQSHGFDFSAVQKRDNGKWYHNKPGTDGSKNHHRVVYGKKVHSISSGTVVRCWRNAPENPGPGQTHPMRLKKLIGGGGNAVWVRQDDGNMVLYAHMQPGTIPKSLCPIEAKYFTKPSAKEETNIPKAKQKRVKKGQYLGRVGNSGKSGGPHLHLHMITSSNKPAKIIWDGGLSKTATKNGGYVFDDYTGWKAMRGKTLVDSHKIVWPPFYHVSTITRNSPVSHFQAYFSHSNHSGFWPVKLQGKVNGGKLWYYSTWKKAKKPWKGWFGLDKATRDKHHASTIAAGYKKTYEWYVTLNGKKYYSIVFQKK